MEATYRERERHRGHALFFAAWTIAVLFRIVWPLADPPADLSWSGGYMADEGFWVHDARNIALFGDEGPDEWHNRCVSPLVHPPILLLFRLLGPSLLTVRIWAMILSLLTLYFLDRICRRIDPSGILFTCFAVNSILIAYQRTAILESAVLPPATATLWLWLLARDERTSIRSNVLDSAAGIAAAAAWLIKGTQIYFMPVVLLATLLAEPSLRRARKPLLMQVLGMAVVGISWCVAIRIPHSLLLQKYNTYYVSQQGDALIDFLKNFLMQPPAIYFSRMPVLFPAALLLILTMMIRHRFRMEPPVLIFAATWMILGILFLAPFGYRPLRYYLPLLIPTIILGWRFLTRRSIPPVSPAGRGLAAFITFLLVLSTIPLVLDRYLLHGRITGIPPASGFPLTGPILSVIVTGLILIPPFIKDKPITGRRLALLLAVSVSFHGITAVNRLIHRRYDVLETSRELARRLPHESVIAGQWAPQLALETPFRAVPMWKNFVNDRNPVERFGVTHVLSWEYVLGDELDYQKQWFPEMMQSARRLAVFRLKDSDVSLWELPAAPGVNHVNPQQFQGLQTTGHPE